MLRALALSMWFGGLAGKRATAAAAALDVGVVHGEAGAHEAVHVVELASHDVGDAHGVDEHPDALGLEDLVVLGDLVVEVDAVLESGAAAGPDADAQREILLAFLGHEGLDLLCGVVGDGDDGGLFLLLHQHLPCCSRSVGKEIITPQTVYFNAPSGSFGEAFRATPWRVAPCGLTRTFWRGRAARSGSRPRASCASPAIACNSGSHRGVRKRPVPHPRSGSRGARSRPWRNAPWDPPPRPRPRRGATSARSGSAPANRRRSSCPAVARH